MDFLDQMFHRNNLSKSIVQVGNLADVIFKHSPEAILILNKEGVIVRTNSRITEWIGYPVDYIVGRSFTNLAFVEQGTKEILKKMFSNRMSGQKVSPYEIKLFARNGGAFYGRLHASVIKNESGEIVGEIVMISNISETMRIVAEEREIYDDIKKLSLSAVGFVELKKDDNIFQYIGECLNDLIGDCYIIVNRFISEKNSTTTEAIVGATEKAEKFLSFIKAWPIGREYEINEYARMNLLRRDLMQLDKGIYELYDGAIPMLTAKIMEKVFSVGDIYTMGFSWEKEIYGNAVVITKKGAIVRKDTLKAFLHQASVALQKRKTDEEIQRAKDQLEVRVQERTKDLEHTNRDLEKFKLAVKDASDTILITDIDGKIVYANLAAQLNTKYSFSEMGGKTPDLWVMSKENKNYHGVWEKLKKEKNAFLELNNKSKNGREYFSEVHVSSVLDEKDKPVFYVWIERDTTKAKEIDKAKSEFVSLASHQLRTPLSAINWYTEMLLDGDAGKINDDQISYLKEIYGASQRMVDLVNSLLNVSRLELGTFIIEPKNSSLADISKDVLKELDNQILRKKLKITEDYDTIPNIMVDPKLTRMIFQNLLSNAVKYTPDNGKIAITIGYEKKREINENILVTIADTGYGIPSYQQDRVFTKLFRADNVKKMETEGTGLGMYIIKSILENSGGKIWFESEENKGTKFYFTIPLNGMKRKEGTKEIG